MGNQESSAVAKAAIGQADEGGRKTDNNELITKEIFISDVDEDTTASEASVLGASTDFGDDDSSVDDDESDDEEEEGTYLETLMDRL